MKTLFVIRHAKSSWDHMGLADHDRPLNDRGIRDAPKMAEWLLDQGEQIESIITSTAVRAKKTAIAFQVSQGIPPAMFLKTERLFHADEQEIEEVVMGCGLDAQSLAIFGHNPGMTYFLNLIQPGVTDNLPTCGLAKISCDCDSWVDFDVHKARIEYLKVPRDI